jgi:S-adenosylmethionine:tRNA ribosyltransferase-isomerase
MSTPFTFTLPPELMAQAPPEHRGMARDQVRLMVIDRRTSQVHHAQFAQLGMYLRRGDLLVYNSSRTLPAALHGCAASGGPCLEVRLAEHLPDESWLALLLCQHGAPFACGLRPRLHIAFGEGLTATVVDRDATIPRLWQLRFSASGPALIDLLYRLGHPIRYEYVSAPWGLDAYQTVYAQEPGSTEMPSAGRAFTWQRLFALQGQGITTASVVLHTGLSSYMDETLDRQHLAAEEEYRIPSTTAAQIQQTRRRGGRIIAVGTTVVRALESAAQATGVVQPGHGYTRLRITAAHVLKTVDGLLTGLHEPEASHLDLLTAFLPAEQIRAAYEEAVQQRYLWHEFGDLNLIL